MFTLRLSYSGKAVHRAYATCSQEAFLDGHRYAFEQLGGIPFVHIRYDNLKAAVSRVLTGRTRVESDRWVLFRSHYGFDVFYCRPGVEGAHEKGGVEGEGGRFRRTHTVPMPKVETLAELNAYLAKCDAKDDHRRVGQRTDAGRRRLRHRTAAAAPVAGRAVRDRDQPAAPGRPARPRDGAAMPVLGAGALRRPPGPGSAARHHRAGLRRAPAGRRTRTGHRTRQRHPRSGPLPRGAGLQARRAARRDRTRAGPQGRGVHRDPRAVLDRGEGPLRRQDRHPGPGRGPAPAPHLPPPPGPGRHRSRPRTSARSAAEAVAVEVRRAGETRPQLGLVGADGHITYPVDTRPLPTVEAYDTLLTGGNPT